PVSGGYVTAPGHIGFHLGPHDPSRPLVIDPQLAYSTYIGGTQGGGIGNDGSMHGVAVDAAAANYPVREDRDTHHPTTPTLAQESKKGNGSHQNAVISKLSSTGSTLVWSTYLGGSGNVGTFVGEHGYGIALNAVGEVYVTGQTSSPDFPSTGGYQTVKPAAAG